MKHTDEAQRVGAQDVLDWACARGRRIREMESAADRAERLLAEFYGVADVAHVVAHGVTRPTTPVEFLRARRPMTKKQSVLSVMNGHPVTAADVARLLPGVFVSDRHAAMTLVNLCSAGRVQRVGAGLYQSKPV